MSESTSVTDRSVDQSARVRLKLSLNKTCVQVVSFIASLSGCQFVSFAGGLVSLHLSLLRGFCIFRPINYFFFYQISDFHDLCQHTIFPVLYIHS